mgnify:CR=1 FL=1
MTTTELLAGLTGLPLYRVRLTGGSIATPNGIVHNHGRRLFTARADARDCDVNGGYTVVLEAYDRHTGTTIRAIPYFAT